MTALLSKIGEQANAGRSENYILTLLKKIHGLTNNDGKSTQLQKPMLKSLTIKPSLATFMFHLCLYAIHITQKHVSTCTQYKIPANRAVLLNTSHLTAVLANYICSLVCIIYDFIPINYMPTSYANPCIYAVFIP